MSLDNRPQDSEPLTSIEPLIGYLRAGEKPRNQHRVGMEHEKIGLLSGNRDPISPIPYDGPRGIEAILNRFSRYGYTPFLENGRPIAATGTAAGKTLSVSLEPGGQLELSGSPFHCCNDLSAELRHHLAIVQALGAELGQTWLGVGYRPFGTVAQAQWVPKGRYSRMREHLSRSGRLGLDMMTMTGTVQANFDFADEADMVAKIRCAQRVSPLVTALFANSPLRDGKKTGDLSFRQQVWRDVDPARCGLRPEYFADGFGYRAYVEWALDIPMIFVRRNGAYLDPGQTTFRRFMKDGLQGERATLSDFEDHLTTLFPEVRLKKVIEVRSADMGDARMCLALPALWKGIFYSPAALETAAQLVPVSFEGIDHLSKDAARDGFRVKAGKHTVLDLCRELVRISAEGLRSQEHCGSEEGRFLDVLFEELERRTTPADEALALLDGPYGGDVTKLIPHWRVA